MNRKSILIVNAIIICMLVGLNIYTITSSKKISKYVDESSSDTQSIVLIDKLRTNINKLAQAQKLYLLTSKEEYKTEYYEELQYVYKLIDEMAQSGKINVNEKYDLIKAVNEYDELAQTLKNKSIGDEITPQFENDVLKSNNGQLNVLQHLDNSVEATNKALLNKNDTITSSSQFQAIWVQLVSTIITGIGSVFVYYIKVYSQKSKGKVGKIINYITDEEDNLDKKIINEDNTKDYYKKCMEDLMKYERMLDDAKLIYRETININNKIKEVNNTIDKIEISLEKLKEKIEQIDNCSSEIKSYLIKDVEDEIINLRILFQALPIYNDVISEISQDMKNRGYTKEL